MFGWLQSDAFKKAVIFVGSVAAAGAATFPPNTVAWKVCITVVGLVGAKGVYSTGVGG